MDDILGYKESLGKKFSLIKLLFCERIVSTYGATFFNAYTGKLMD